MGSSIVFGAFQFDRKGQANQRLLLEACEQNGIQEIDSGVIYEGCEKLLSSLDVPGRFVVHGKASPGRNSKPEVLESASRSMEDLGFPQDGSTKFGLSNFVADDVQRFHDYGKAKGYVLPTVYQGLYNAVCRRGEAELLPTLRRLGMAFYCYSPLGATYFMVSPDAIKDGKGRFDNADVDGLVYQALFNQPAYLAALDSWRHLAQQCRLQEVELAWRWINFHSSLRFQDGDKIITSAENAEQLQQLFAWRAKGALESWVVDGINEIWESCRSDAPLDCVNGWFEAIALGRVVPPSHMQYN
ncbi:hypothetical protein PG985_015009 [Apiospora marii]|uniref:NADP-dependent oxidoreductase domain-containing protein n=1 Tax=Apiospora marii TaxID=335849 RepID=A0ABR1RJH2_9PEZI